jgi:hypothetical protein
MYYTPAELVGEASARQPRAARRFGCGSATLWGQAFTLTLYVLLLAGSVSSLAAQSASNAVPLSLEQVLKLSQAGVSEDLIITAIKKNGKPFDLSTDEILVLKKSGLSDTVIEFLLDPSRPYTPPAPKAPEPPPTPQPKPVPAKKYPDDPNAARVPADPGLYTFPKGSLAKVDVRMLLGEKEGGFLLKKGKSLAYLVGPSAKLRVSEGAPVFYIRLAEGKGIEELLLVTLEHKNDRREFDPGPGPKPELKPEMLKQFDSLEVGPALYRLTPAKLSAGEYLFFLSGSAEPAKGNFGKGYDFGVDAPIREKH